mgnify:CR=1 FL=1
MITVIQIHQGGIIIGEANEVMGEVVLKSPRVIQMQQAGPGQVNIQLLVMIGDPKEIRIRAEAAVTRYVPDEALTNSYREAVTGLTLAKTIPDLKNVRPFPGRSN